MFSQNDLSIRDELFDDIENRPPAEIGRNDAKQFAIFTIANEYVFANQDVGKQYCSESEAEIFYKQMVNAETRISFNGKYISTILQEGYKHWSLLEKTDNTDNLDLLIQRVHSEYSLFGINVYNDNVLLRCEELYNNDKKKFLNTWNERFERNIQNPRSVEEIFILSGFEKGSLPREVIFGALFYDGKLLKAENLENDYVSKYYGKSQLVIKNSCRDKSTYCLADSFDASAFSFHTKNPLMKDEPQKALFTLSDKSNVVYRLMAYTGFKDIPYVENHLYERITAKQIDKVFLSAEETKLCEDALSAMCEKLMKEHNIKVYII